MNPPDYRQFFEKATGGRHNPFDYQIRLAEDAECKSRLINIPAGCGIALSKNTMDDQAASRTPKRWKPERFSKHSSQSNINTQTYEPRYTPQSH
jgi:hypothetical protein